MKRFGKDNPDLRFGMELCDITDLVVESGFVVFERVISSGGHVRGINAKTLGDYSRKQIDELTLFVQQYGAQGLSYIALGSDGGVRSTLSKFIPQERMDKIIARMGGERRRSITSCCG